MKKLVSLSNNIAKMVEDYAKENETQQSKVIEVAIALYFDRLKPELRK
jgi:hypothetical protein